MVDIQAKVSAKTTVNDKEFEFVFDNGVDIKDATQALSDISQHLIDVVTEQNEKNAEMAKKEAVDGEVVQENETPLAENDSEKKVEEV